MYFNNFPQIQYDPTGNGTFSTIQDIMTRIKVRDYIKNNTSLFSKYSVPDGSTPEMVAFFLYGDTAFHWILLLFNQIINTYYDWPLSRKNFQKYVSDKYANPDAVHHYEVSQSSGGDWVKIKVESDVSVDDLIKEQKNPVKGSITIEEKCYHLRSLAIRNRISCKERSIIFNIISHFDACHYILNGGKGTTTSRIILNLRKVIEVHYITLLCPSGRSTV